MLNILSVILQSVCSVKGRGYFMVGTDEFAYTACYNIMLY